MILFLSDAVDELDAARKAGLPVDRRADYREACTGPPTHGHPRAESFTEIDPG